ncbi:MAG: alpha/beta hydrolase [Sulfurifustis sp.]
MGATTSRAALTVIGSALAGITYYAYRKDIRRARERATTGSQIAQTPCGPIEYAAAGSGPPVLIVHGAGGGFDQGMSFGRELADHFHVIAPSRFGYLRTPLPADASAAAQADAHAYLLDSLNIRQVAVIGASAGAPSAMQFALRHPQRTKTLVLLVPAAYASRPGGAPSMTAPPLIALFANTALKSDFLFWAAIKLAPDAVIRSVLATPPDLVKHADAEEQTRIRRVLDLILPVSPRRRGLLNDARVCSTLPRYELERITAPTLAISTADDGYGTFDGARYTAEHIPGARFRGYPSGGHLWVGHQHDVASEVAAFLERQH